MKFLNRLSIRWKVLSAPAIAMICMAVYFASTVFVFKQNNYRLADMRDVQFPVLEATTENVGALEKIIDNLNSAATSGEVDQLKASDLIAEKVRTNYSRLLSLNTGTKESIQQLHSEFEAYYRIAKDVAQMMAQQSGVPKPEQLQAMSAALDAYRKHLNMFRDDAHKHFVATIGEMTGIADKAVTAGGVIGVIGLAITLVFGVAIARSLVQQLNSAVRVAQTVAAGDLTSHIRVTSNDETGKLLRALKEMNDGLVQIVGQVRSGTNTITRASRQIADGNMALSSRTEQQAGSLEEAASSMEELISTVRQNSENAKEANTLATSASEIAQKGGQVVSKVIDTMDAISDSARKIVEIISVIDGIAFQTNILALNASVEAARAGEQGRGFAVVASEVRNLAQRSAGAAKEIKALIVDSVEKVDAGTKLVAEAGTTMSEIVESVTRVTGIMGEITIAGREQSTGIEQVNQTIIQMDLATQKNAALVEAAAATSITLHNQANDLSRAVSVFKVGDDSNGDAHKPQPGNGQVSIAPRQNSQARTAANAEAGKNTQRLLTVSRGEWEEF